MVPKRHSFHKTSMDTASRLPIENFIKKTSKKHKKVMKTPLIMNRIGNAATSQSYDGREV